MRLRPCAAQSTDHGVGHSSKPKPAHHHDLSNRSEVANVSEDLVRIGFPSSPGPIDYGIALGRAFEESEKIGRVEALAFDQGERDPLEFVSVLLEDFSSISVELLQELFGFFVEQRCGVLAADTRAPALGESR